MIPPAYPRIPHLFPQPGMDSDDRVLSAAEAEAVLTRPLVVEEKLDGFNISIACDARGWPVPYARSGKSQGDRGGQLGRIRAFIGEEADALRSCLDEWPVLYAEWLMRRHSVEYDALPSWLVVLDLWSPDRGFAPVKLRDRMCSRAGLATPPRLHEGVVLDEAMLERLCRLSRFGSVAAEGVVLRDPGTPGAGPVAKWLAPWFRRQPDDVMGRNLFQPALARMPGTNFRRRDH